MFYCIWIPLLITICCFASWLSSKAYGNWKWFWMLFLTNGLLQVWPFVAKYSKQIVIDAIFYDAIMIVAYIFSLMFFTGTKFQVYQWVGSVLVMLGLICIQLKSN
jgi:drug/metabolite transporter (DMT)-like permease